MVIERCCRGRRGGGHRYDSPARGAGLSRLCARGERARHRYRHPLPNGRTVRRGAIRTRRCGSDAVRIYRLDGDYPCDQRGSVDIAARTPWHAATPPGNAQDPVSRRGHCARDPELWTAAASTLPNATSAARPDRIVTVGSSRGTVENTRCTGNRGCYPADPVPGRRGAGAGGGGVAWKVVSVLWVPSSEGLSEVDGASSGAG